MKFKFAFVNSQDAALLGSIGIRPLGFSYSAVITVLILTPGRDSRRHMSFPPRRRGVPDLYERFESRHRIQKWGRFLPTGPRVDGDREDDKCS